MSSFLSDHGEEFMEHGGLAHSHALWDEVIKVPLIFSLPGVIASGAQCAVPAQLVDVMPTILDLLGLEAPPGVQGQSLLPYALSPANYAPRRPLFSRKAEPPHKNHEDSVRFGDWKLIRRDMDGAYECLLFDTAKDPEEIVNRWAAEPIVGKALLQMLRWRLYRDLLRAPPMPDPVVETEIDDETLKNMKALGYL